MASFEELRQARLDKLAILKKNGIDPYPATVKRDFYLNEAVEKFTSLAGASAGNAGSARETTRGTTNAATGGIPASDAKIINLVGRVMSLRPQGGLIFFHIYDGTAKFQGLLKHEDIEAKQFELFSQTVDIGDFIGVEGVLFETKRGEKTILAKNWTMLAKSLRPLPEKWHGLQDVEERLRNRYLDILFNSEVRDMIEKKAKFWQSMRNFFLKENFLEVETPVLENTTGGADARPFATHHNALNIDIYLRISAGELWQKRLMVAGFPKVFEIGRIFRNEGISPEHAQDYTQLEFYWAYADYQQGMGLVERLYKHVARETFGTLKFKIGQHEIDLDEKWERYDFAETIQKITGIDIVKATLKDIEKKLKTLKIDFDPKGWNKNRAIDGLWKYCRKQIAGPGFLINIPTFLSPLAKPQPGKSFVVQQFQPILAGSEMGKGYSELNDPLDQASRFAEQAKMREAGDEEAQMNDKEFVEALEYGMPPACGFGVSERLFAFLIDKPVRETQIFPLMRPKK
jgi:lysyl-tRNA synthetase class 2